MNKKHLLLSTAAAGLIAAGTLTIDGASTDAYAKDKEKCYGVVKAGKNDCGVRGGHSCAGQATVDGDKEEWLYVPKGMCDRLVSGSTKPGGDA